MRPARRSTSCSGGCEPVASLGHDDRDPTETTARGAARILRGRRPGRSDRSNSSTAPYVRKETCTTSMWSSSCVSAGRSSWRRRPRCPPARPWSSRPTASRPPCTRTPRAAALKTIDATCPLVTKVHVGSCSLRRGTPSSSSATRATRRVEGTMGEAPEHFVLVETEDDGRAGARGPRPRCLPHQTTLSVDETDRIIRRLRERFPNITGPKSDDIRYATTNRQMAGPPDGPRVRSRAGHRVEELIELQSAGGGGPRPRRRLDRQRDPGAGGVARGQAGWWASALGPAPSKSWSNGSWSTSAPAAPPRYPSSRSSRRMFASCSRDPSAPGGAGVN